MVLVAAALGWRLGNCRRSTFCIKKRIMGIYLQYGAAHDLMMTMLRLTRNKA